MFRVCVPFPKGLFRSEIVIFCFFILFSLNIHSQIPGSKKIYSLNECLQIAKSNNFDLRINEARMQKSGAQLTNAFGNYLPSINLNMGYRRDLNPEGPTSYQLPNGSILTGPAAPPDNYSINAYATLPIFDGFSREAIYTKSQHDYNTNYLISQHTFKQIEFDIYSQYIDVIRIMKIIKIRQENLELGKKQLEKIRAQYNAGIVSIGNVYAQDAELGNQEYDLITTENELENAKSKLLATMGLQPDIDAEFLESSLPTEVDENELLNFRKSIGSYGAAVNNALKNRFDFNAYIESVESAKNSITIAQSGYFPKLYTTLGWQSSGTKFDDLDKTDRTYLNLNLSIPIFENFDANYNIQNAQLTLTQQETELKRLEQNIRSSVRISFLNLEAAEKQIDLTNRTLKSSLENYNSTKQRFDVGAANITELFAANNQMIISQINRINSVYNYIKAQKYALYVTGLL